MNTDIIKLQDVEVTAREHPDTFKIPALPHRQNLHIGDFAKLIFESWAGTERMWVKVYGIEATNNVPSLYYGELDNEPIRMPGLKRGDKVEFEPRHVADVLGGVDNPVRFLEKEDS